jgi:predicted lipoprotein with Yx(FWY)xxD motif
MSEVNIPVQSLKTIVISSVLASLLAFFILIALVAPAEYGIDPTGLGEKLGLMILAEKQVASSKKAVSCPTGSLAADWQDIVMITVPPNSGLEYKFAIQKGATILYQWHTNGTALYFDFHGEPKGDSTGYFKSYQLSTLKTAAGEQLIPFTGSHGWYWKNNSADPVQLTLKTKGNYKIKGLM